MKRTKPVLCLLLCVIFAFASVGCGDSNVTTKVTSSSSQPVGVASTAPVEKLKDELIIANAIDITSADKMENSTLVGNQNWDMIYDGLANRNPETGKIELALAESYQQVNDTEYVFKLRKGVLFHNGDEFTSKDVIHTHNRMKKMPVAASYTTNIKELIAEDDYTVRYKLNTKSAIFLEHLTQTCGKMESKKAYEDNGNKFINCGTGPYKFGEWVPSKHITLERFDKSWDKGAKTKKITMRIIPEGAARVIALETGEIDIALEPPTIDLKHIQSNKDCVLKQIPACKLDYFSVNSQKAPFTDPKVRLALAKVMNKQEIITAVLEGNGTPANNVVGYGTMTWTNDLKPINNNLAEAKALLAETKYAKGFKFAVTLNGDIRNRVAQVLQAQFAQLGIEMSINSWDNATHRQHINSGQFDASISSWSNPGDPDIILRNMFHSSMVGVNNRTWLAEPAVDAKLDALVQELDKDKRIAGYKALQQELLDKAVMIPMYYETLNIGMRSNVKGVMIDSGGMHWYRYAYAVK